MLVGIRYDIEARISEADIPKWNNPTLQPAMLRAMLQGMLVDRFKIVVHREVKQLPIFELTVGRGGPKFKPSEQAALADIEKKHPGAFVTFGGAIVANGVTPGEMMAFGETMPTLCAALSNMAGRPIQDKTGLTGKYDLRYQLELPPLPQPGGSMSAPPDLSLQISTVMDQLGLKLTPTRGPVETLVIDHIERPSAN